MKLKPRSELSPLLNHILTFLEGRVLRNREKIAMIEASDDHTDAESAIAAHKEATLAAKECVRLCGTYTTVGRVHEAYEEPSSGEEE